MNDDMQSNAKAFLNQLEGALDSLHSAFAPIRQGPPNFYFKTMTEWIEAFFQRGPFKVGDKVQLIDVPEIGKGHGWHGYQKTFHLGAIGKVVQMDYHDGHFQAQIVWDEEWRESSRLDASYNYESYQKKVEPEDKHLFTMCETALVRYDPPYTLWVPWRGTTAKRTGRPRAIVWERGVKPRLAAGSHVQPKRSKSHFLGWVITNPTIEPQP